MTTITIKPLTVALLLALPFSLSTARAVLASPINAYVDSTGQPQVSFSPGGVVTLSNTHLAQPGSGNSPQPLTQEMMLKSTPVDFPIFLQGTNATATAARSQGPLLTLNPNSPNPQANSVAAQTYADQWALLKQNNATANPVNTGTFTNPSCYNPDPTWGPLDCNSHPWTGYPGNSYPQYQMQYPWKAVGKLFFHTADQSQTDDYHHCTAQVISGPPKNLIVTASHCVRNPNNNIFHKDWVFVPAEMSGIKPYGEFQYNMVIVGPPSNEIRRSDVALISLQNDSQGKPVSFYTGTLGLMINAPYTQNLTLMGYSVQEVPEGVSTSVNTGQSFYFEDQTQCKGFSGEDVLLIGSSFGPGSSGGAWINQFYPFNSPALDGNYVTGVVSGPVQCGNGIMDVTSPPSILSGPRFSNANIGILCNAVGGCGVPAHAECVFDWAEINYSNMFSPAGTVATQFSSPYSYRAYPTDFKLGVSLTNNHVYYKEPNTTLHDVGPLADWATKAGCRNPS